MKTIKETTKLAKTYLGKTGETFWKFIFPNYKYVNGNVTPYCACFASYLAKKADIKVEGLPGAYCPTIFNKWKKSSRFVADPKKLKEGDFVIFDWQGDGVCDHIGYVTGNNGKYISTLEGNTNGGIVAQRTRAYSTVAGGYRPSYAKETAASSAANNSKSATKSTSSASSTGAAVSKPKTGVWKTVVDALNVRKGPGTNYAVKAKAYLTADGKAHSNSNGQLKKGTKATVSFVSQDSGGSWWGKIPSGYICLYYKPSKKWYCEKV